MMSDIISAIINILNSNFFIAFVTFTVGLVALVVYIMQKNDRKREAANIILLEVQNAERNLKLIKKSLKKDPPELPNDLKLLPTENWSKYSYLFIRDFDRDEWDEIASFYHKCQLIDETISHNNAAFWGDVEQIRANKQRILADHSNDSAKKLEVTVDVLAPDDTKIVQKFTDITDKFDTLYMSRQVKFGYTPQKTINDAKLYIDDINYRISQASVGAKIKKLAKIKS